MIPDWLTPVLANPATRLPLVVASVGLWVWLHHVAIFNTRWFRRLEARFDLALLDALGEKGTLALMIVVAAGGYALAGCWLAEDVARIQAMKP